MPKEPEDLLWELSNLESRDEGSVPDDEALRRYREGEMTPAEASKMESALSHNRGARERLAALSSLRQAQPSPALRNRVLASLPPRTTAKRPAWRKIWPAAAAVLLALLAAPVYWLIDTSPETPPISPYEIRVFGIAAVRSETAPITDVVRAFPQTRVRIELNALSASNAAVDYGLYRLDVNQIGRLDVQPHRFKGAARFEAAGSVLAPSPGTWTLFVVVAESGRLPANRLLQAGQDPVEELKRLSKGQVFSLRLELLPAG